jgi:hypothetical protein
VRGGGEGCGGSPGEPSGQAAQVGSIQFHSVPPTSAQPADEPGEQHAALFQPSPPTPSPAYTFPPSTSPWAWGSVVAGPEGPGLVWDAQCVGCGTWGRVLPIVPIPTH